MSQYSTVLFSNGAKFIPTKGVGDGLSILGRRVFGYLSNLFSAESGGGSGSKLGGFGFYAVERGDQGGADDHGKKGEEGEEVEHGMHLV